jgi:phosphatidylglycerol lysyltransferase
MSTSTKVEPATGVTSARRTWDGVIAFAALQVREARRAPVTIALVVIMWIAGAVTGSLLDGPSVDLQQSVAAGVGAFQDGAWWTPFTSAFFAGDLVTYLGVTILLLVVGSLCERRWGSLRMLWMSSLVQIVGVALGVGLVALADAFLDWQWAEYLAADFAVGATPLIAGLLMAFSGGLSALWRRRIRLGVLTVCLVALLYGGQLQDVLRMSTALVGLLAGALILHTGDRKLVARASRRETRVLVAVVVAATALGPILVAVTGEVEGPLSALADLYVGPNAYADTSPNRDLADILMSVMPAVLVLVLAAGLRRGRRFAWWATLVFHVLLLALGTFYAIDYYNWAVENDELDEGFSWVAWLLPLMLLPVLIVVILLITRRSFTVQAPVGIYRKLGVTVLGILLALWAVYAVVGSLVADQFRPTASFGVLILDFPIRLLPNGYLYIIEPAITTTAGIGRFLVDWIPVLVWAVILVGLLRSFIAARVESADGDRARARVILERHGTTALAYLTTWHGNSYWFSADGGSFVAYRVEGGVAITTGDPVGPPDDLARATEEFVGFCNAENWTPCFYSTTEALKTVTDGFGWPSLQVAEETVLPLGKLAFTGKKFQDIRTSISRAGKGGITAEWLSYHDAPLAIRDQIQAISEEWVSDKALPEMGFTLGGLEELDDPAVRCLIAVDQDRTIHGITSWMPCYRDGIAVGWTLDFMRRRGEGFKGVMEFLIGSAALDLQKEGAEFVSLSGAPLAQANPGDVQDPVQRLLEVLGRTMEPVYGFRSLLKFKAKFQPVYQPMYMCYPEATVLPRIGLGISHAYLPNMTFGQAVRMMGQLA